MNISSPFTVERREDWKELAQKERNPRVQPTRLHGERRCRGQTRISAETSLTGIHTDLGTPHMANCWTSRHTVFHLLHEQMKVVK